MTPMRPHGAETPHRRAARAATASIRSLAVEGWGVRVFSPSSAARCSSQSVSSGGTGSSPPTADSWSAPVPSAHTSAAAMPRGDGSRRRTARRHRAAPGRGGRGGGPARRRAESPAPRRPGPETRGGRSSLRAPAIPVCPSASVTVTSRPANNGGSGSSISRPRSDASTTCPAERRTPSPISAGMSTGTRGCPRRSGPRAGVRLVTSCSSTSVRCPGDVSRATVTGTSLVPAAASCETPPRRLSGLTRK